ncbi:salivary peroxidase/catechol oxidase-like [Crassostrea virginica]
MDSRPLLLVLFGLFLALSNTSDGQNIDNLRHAAEKAMDFGKKVFTEHQKELREFRNKGIDKKGQRNVDRHNIVTRAKPDTSRLQEVGEISIETARYLMKTFGMSLKDISASTTVQDMFQSKYYPSKTNCDEAKFSAYRSLNGSCNNINHPNWGAAITAQPRYQHAHYDDGLNSPRSMGEDGNKLPSAREISNRLFRAPGDATEADQTQSLMVMAWGQFVDHDLAATPVTQGDNVPISCCGEDVMDRVECFPISIPLDDPHFQESCMAFVRSAPAPSGEYWKPGARQQINQITSFIDGDIVYGNSKMQMMALVDSTTGHMLTSPGDLLPPGPDGTCVLSDEDDFCQKAGDKRVNVVPTLGGTHLLFVREHNRIAAELQKIRTDWSPGTVFQETRKIIGALLQQITYREFIPSILSEADIDKYGLKLKTKGHSNSYNKWVNPGTKNVFNAAAFRFGHSQIPPTTAYVLQDFMTLSESTPIESTFMDPHLLITEGGSRVVDLARFIVTSNSMKSDSHLEKGVRDHLFEDAQGRGFDLGALNLQRGRDHGLPAYNVWRKWCGLPVASSFDDLVDISETNKAIFADVYSNVNDIDVYAGGLSETPSEGASVGPLFSCIIGRQFRDLKVGDRYWYETPGVEGFNMAQLKEIRKVYLSKILCENFGLDSVQPDVFRVPTIGNARQSCASLPGIDFSAWKKGKKNQG